MTTVYEIVTEKIINAMENGRIPWQKPWTPGNAPRNAESNRPYHGVNAWLLAAEAEAKGYTDQAWITYEGAKRLGANVRKGEHGALVTFWKIGTYNKTNDNGETTEENSFILRYYTVFNVAQLENYTPKPSATPEAPQFTPLESAEMIKQGYAPARGPEVKHASQDRAYYSPDQDYIMMPTPEQFKTPEQYYSVLFHEMGHSTGHASRLDRFSHEHSHHFGSQDYSKEELVAEMTAAFICAECGISNERTETNSIAYVQSWISALKNDPKMVVMASSKAQKAADYILNRTTSNAE